VLGGILGMAGATGDMQQGMFLLSVYSIGLAIPFLVAALAVDKFRGWFSKFRRWMPWVQRISGAVLILVGLLLVSGEFTRLAGWLNSLTPAWLLERL
jgi:cytochrome c-type biogenesis protein